MLVEAYSQLGNNQAGKTGTLDNPKVHELVESLGKSRAAEENYQVEDSGRLFFCFLAYCFHRSMETLPGLAYMYVVFLRVE